MEELQAAPPPDPFPSLQRAAAEFDIEPEVAFGLMRAESSFRNRRRARSGRLV
jgi:soluble lytic murein transglycosylase-like protein